MIKKILKINDLGIFSNFHWKTDLPEFKRFNVIYGWNGSGKSTLTQLFSSLNSEKPEDFPSLTFRIKSDQGEFSDTEHYPEKVKVFNQEYIQENIDIISSTTKPILILGKENKELLKIITTDEKVLSGDPSKKNDLGLIKSLSLKEKDLERNIKVKGKLFTDVAKVIGSSTIGVSARNYRKNNAQIDFEALKSKQILSDDELEKNIATLKQQEMPKLALLDVSELKENCIAITGSAESLLKRTVATETIDRIKNNPDISKWVEAGLELHIQKESVNCEYCNRPLPETRVSALLAFFNEADKILKSDLDKLLVQVDELSASIENSATIDKANFYSEFQLKYVDHTNEFNRTKKLLLKDFQRFKEALGKKKYSTTESLSLYETINPSEFLSSISSVNETIAKHNIKSKNFMDAKDISSAKVKKHYLSEIFDEVKIFDQDIKVLENEISILKFGIPGDSENVGINSIQDRVEDNKRKMSSSGTGCAEINKRLRTFLGRDDLTFHVADQGYLIKRKGRMAKRLSEGEKSAIAFVYFTIHLQDQSFNLQDGIVVIDDPVSSLDSNSIFQAFSFLKNSVKDCSQVFIFTHNYDFLKLVLFWLKYVKSEYYMITNHFSGEDRIADLDPLDELLRNHPSEYQYLFKIVTQYRSDGTIENAYHIPNIARKVLEYFLWIMIPDNRKIYKKLEQIDFDEYKKTAIYKFTNDQSHITGNGFDPSIVNECQNNVNHLLEMMEATFPEHYSILKNSIGGNT